MECFSVMRKLFIFKVVPHSNLDWTETHFIVFGWPWFLRNLSTSASQVILDLLFRESSHYYWCDSYSPQDWDEMTVECSALLSAPHCWNQYETRQSLWEKWVYLKYTDPGESYIDSAWSCLHPSREQKPKAASGEPARAQTCSPHTFWLESELPSVTPSPTGWWRLQQEAWLKQTNKKKTWGSVGHIHIQTTTSTETSLWHTGSFEVEVVGRM